LKKIPGAVCSRLGSIDGVGFADGVTEARFGGNLPILTCSEAMEKIAHSEKIQTLDRRHTELIEELDALNHQLEQALSSFNKPLEPADQV